MDFRFNSCSDVVRADYIQYSVNPQVAGYFTIDRCIEYMLLDAAMLLSDFNSLNTHEAAFPDVRLNLCSCHTRQQQTSLCAEMIAMRGEGRRSG